MKQIYLTFIIVLSVHQTYAQQKSPIDYVNVFTGTSNSRWMMFPGATLPFGMVKLSPDNQGNVWNGGYEYGVSSISGFSHLHAMSLSGLSLMPVTGKIETNPGEFKLFPGAIDGPFKNIWTAGYRSRFDKSTEHGRPGYYTVELLDYNVKVELTSTARTGWCRFNFPKDSLSHILYDFGFATEEKNEIIEVVVQKIAATIIEGYVKQKNQYAGEHTVYFTSEFSQPIAFMNGWTTERYQGNEMNYGTAWRDKQNVSKNIGKFTAAGPSGIYLDFVTLGSGEIIVRTAISFVSNEQARLNMTEEAYPFQWDFDKVTAKAARKWNDLLSTVEVTGNEKDMEQFYTCFYRCFTGKSILSDANGKYTDMCEKTQQLDNPEKFMLSADGSWGTQWNLAPVWTLLTPHYASTICNSYINFYNDGGWMPEAPTGLEYAPIMGSQHHKSLIISSYQKGIRDFDVMKSWEAVKHDLTTPGSEHPCGGYAGNRQLNSYLKHGYVADEDGASSNTLEYAYDDWCAAQFAKALGFKSDYEYFLKRSANYKNQFDAKTKYMRRKSASGQFVSPFEPLRFGTEGGWNGPGFMEGNAWLFTFFVPHDINGLIQLAGRETLSNRLKEGFDKGYVDMGNQPNMEAPFLFNYFGEPWNTQKYSRKAVKDFYNLSPYSGWIGEEDEGQLSALYVLLSLGLFEMDGGCGEIPYYDLGSPIFDHVKINLSPKYYGGKTFEIVTHNNSEKNIFVQSVKFNGKPLDVPRISHQAITGGGILEFNMGPEPNLKWGVTDLKKLTK